MVLLPVTTSTKLNLIVLQFAPQQNINSLVSNPSITHGNFAATPVSFIRKIAYDYGLPTVLPIIESSRSSSSGTY